MAPLNILEELKKRILYSDGAMGTMLQQFGFSKGCPDELNLKDPELVKSVHRAYAEAGSNIILTNTFGANRWKLGQYHLQEKIREINQAGVRIAREAAPNCFIAGDISEIGEYLEPLGKLTFDEAYEIYKEQVAALAEADLLIVETISDIKILRAALIAAKESGKPVIASMTFDGLRTTTGTDVKTFVKVAEALGADIIGANCSAGPKELYEVARIMAQNTNLPLIIQPNAGLPRLVGDRTVFDSNPHEFAEYAQKLVALGVNIIGGCCGTNPEYIKAVVQATKNSPPVSRNNPQNTCFCSRTKTVELGSNTLIVGERINPSGRKEFREELKNGRMDITRKEALIQKQEGASLLDINVGVPGTKESENMKRAVNLVQTLVDLPLVIDTCHQEALLEALKQSDGKPLINSVSGREDSLKKILPLAKKYGAGIIALCLDENNLPETAEERIEIAERIIKAAEEIGFPSEDIVVDCLTLTLATNPEQDQIILEAVHKIKEKGFHTILGISNISYGLPNRSEINQKFFTKASQAGLSLAILNPKDNILCEDTNINVNLNLEKVDYEKLTLREKLHFAILYGDKDNVTRLTEEGLESIKAEEINGIFLSAMEEVGQRFKEKRFFLPQVLASAEAMKLAFESLKQNWKSERSSQGKILFATVENDIHDLGKNLVIAVLESYGYEVMDLGKDVPLKRIIEVAVAEKVDLIALSALMTTTAPEMKKIIRELDWRDLKIPVIIGGAVITSDYAEDLGAAYSPDAISAVKTIQKILKNNQNKNKER